MSYSQSCLLFAFLLFRTDELVRIITVSLNISLDYKFNELFTSHSSSENHKTRNEIACRLMHSRKILNYYLLKVSVTFLIVIILRRSSTSACSSHSTKKRIAKKKIACELYGVFGENEIALYLESLACRASTRTHTVY